MNICTFFQKTLKSLRLFVLILTIVFSFYSYSGGHLIGGGDDKPSYRKKLPHKDQLFMDNLEKHFMKSSVDLHDTPIYYIDESKDVSQAFRQECEGQYEQIKTALASLFNTVEKNLSSKVNEIKDLKSKCKLDLVNNYANLYNEINSIFYFEETKSVFQRVSKRQEWPVEIQTLKDFFNNFDTFRNDCVLSLFHQERDTASEPIHSVEDTLKRLKDNDCFNKRKKIETAKENVKGIFIQSSLNPSGADCVANLRRRAGLIYDDPNVKSLFSICNEAVLITKDCCSSFETCKDRENSGKIEKEKQNHKSQIKYLVKNGDENVCTPGNSGLQELERNFINVTQQFCKHNAEKCNETCNNDLERFKEEFLTCFVAPGFADEHLTHHARSGHNELINQIRKAYQNNSIKNVLLKLDSTAEEIADCQAPWDNLMRNPANLQATARSTVQGWCSSAVAEQKGFQQNSDPLQAYTPPSPTYDTGSNGSRNPSSSKTSQNPPGGVQLQGYSIQKPTSENPFGDSDKNGDKSLASNQDFKLPKPSDSGTEGGGYDSEEECYGICPLDESDPHYSALNGDSGDDSKDLDFKQGDFDRMADEVNDRLRAEREAREKGLKGVGSRKISSYSSSSSVTGGSYQRGFSGMLSRWGGAARKSLQKGYKALVREPKPPPPKLKDVLQIHGSEVDLYQRQRELFYMFCSTHDCGASREELEEFKKTLTQRLSPEYH